MKILLCSWLCLLSSELIIVHCASLSASQRQSPPQCHDSWRATFPSGSAHQISDDFLSPSFSVIAVGGKKQKKTAVLMMSPQGHLGPQWVTALSVIVSLCLALRCHWFCSLHRQDQRHQFSLRPLWQPPQTPHTPNRNIQLKARFSPRCPPQLSSLQVFVFVPGIKSRGILNLSTNLERETGAFKHHGATRTCSKQSTRFSLQGLALRRIAWQVFVSWWIHTPDLLQVVRLQKQTAHLLCVDLGVFNGSLLASCFCKRWQADCTQGNTTWSHLAATDKWLQLGVTWFDNL